MKIYSYHITIGGIITLVSVAIFATSVAGFYGYGSVVVAALFSGYHIRLLPEQIQRANVLKAGDYCKAVKYNPESVENFWREHAKLEEMTK